MPTPRVHLVQCICPARHCIMAVAGEEPPETAAAIVDQLRSAIEQTIAAGRIDPWCALCRAPREQWTFEIVAIPGRTLDEIMPSLRAVEGAQLNYAASLRAEQRHSRN